MRPISLIVSLLLSFALQGQKNYNLTITGESYQHIIKKRSQDFKDSIQVLEFLRKVQFKAISKGFLLASFDSLSFQGKKVSAKFFQGPRMLDLEIQLSDKDLDLLKRTGRLKEKQLVQAPFTPRELSNYMRSILRSSLNKGYPFARVQLDSIQYFEDHATGHLSIFTGPFYRWKSIVIKGDSLISPRLISSLTKIHEGETFDESLFTSISNHLKQVNYIQEIKPAEILFTKDGAELFLYLKSVPVSSASGIIGLQPNPVTEKVSVTGEINLKLTNVLHKGEQLQLNWRSIQPGTQSFNTNVAYPFLFGSPFGVEGGFQLYKRDSTFLETRTSAGVLFMLNNGGNLKAFYQHHSSSLLSGNNGMTSLSGISNNSYGLSFTKRTIDYLPNPTKGLILIIEGSAGSRKSTLPDSTTSVKSTTVKTNLQLTYFIPLTKRQVLKVGTGFETYFAPQVYTNELYRFGGLNTLRGFNEEELFASTKLVGSFEYRFLTDKNSYAFAFFDQGFYENVAGNYKNDHPFGFGAGFSFGTQLGIFSISYAQGKQFDNPILLRNGKVHFGYIAYF